MVNGADVRNAPDPEPALFSCQHSSGDGKASLTERNENVHIPSRFTGRPGRGRELGASLQREDCHCSLWPGLGAAPFRCPEVRAAMMVAWRY
jgi:hypothetical protein